MCIIAMSALMHGSVYVIKRRFGCLTGHLTVVGILLYVLCSVLVAVLVMFYLMLSVLINKILGIAVRHTQTAETKPAWV